MPSAKGSGSKRGGASAPLNGHASHSLGKKRSQKFDSVGQNPSLGGRRASIDVDTIRNGDDSPSERDSDGKLHTGPSIGTSTGVIHKDGGNSSSSMASETRKQIHVGASPGSPTYFEKGSGYASVLPPHQYIDSLAITFFLVNLPTLFLVVVHILFVMFAVSPYSSATERYSSWKTILPAEAFIVLFFALVSPTIKAYIIQLAEPVIASTLAGNGGRGTAICAAVMFAAGRVPNVIFGGFIRLKRHSPGALSDTMVSTAKDLETEKEALDRFGNELQAWILGLIRQLIAIHVVARWSWEGLKQYLTNRVNQSKLEDGSGDAATVAKRRKTIPALSSLSRMPLWTTIANNYIIATKDAELKPPEDLSTYMFENECSFHVEEITSCSVRLCAKGPRDKLQASLGPLDSFEVCVNGLQWREISISEDDHVNDQLYYRKTILCLNIQTLVSSSANEIAVSNPNLPDHLLFHATICTTQKETTTAPTLPQLVRPSSPISTLTDKLHNAMNDLNDLKNNQRRIRKDHKATVATLRTEIDMHHARLDAPEKGEERARRGNLALKYHNMQTEDKIRTLEEEIKQASISITNRQKELHSSRQKWESERSTLETSHRSQHSTKSSLDKFLQQFHAEKLAINARKEKLTAREVKLKGELETLQAAETKRDEECGDRSKKRREARAQLIKDRQASQTEQIIAVEQMELQLAEIKERTARTHGERQLLESMLSQPQSSPVISSPAASSPLISGPNVHDGFRKGSASPQENGESPGTSSGRVENV